MLAAGVGVTIVCVVAWLTFWPVTAELLAWKSVSPLYFAVMEWLPRVRTDVERVALPAVRRMVPSSVVPSRNVTEPVGMPNPGAVACHLCGERDDLAECARVCRRTESRIRFRLVDTLHDRSRAARGEVVVAAVDGGDRMATQAERFREGRTAPS